jgi:hypothetical protein
METSDFILINEDTIFLLQAMSPAAVAWINEFLPPEQDRISFGGSVVIDHRYIGPIVEGIKQAGLTVS